MLLNTDWNDVSHCESTADKWNSFLRGFTPLLDAGSQAQSPTPESLRAADFRRHTGPDDAPASRARCSLPRRLQGSEQAGPGGYRRDCRDHIGMQISERGHKDMWRCVKPIIGSKKGAPTVPNVHLDVLNDYFVGVGPTTAATVPHVPAGLPVRFPRVATDFFQIQPVTYGDLWYVVCNMTLSSSSGLDEISVKLFQKSFSSLVTGEVPSAWKHALVTALLKTKDLSDPSSKFRPTSRHVMSKFIYLLFPR